MNDTRLETLTKPAILCVDDEPILLLSLVQELKREFGNQFYFESALNPKEALEMIDELFLSGVHVILVLSDWLMPEMKGDEFLIKIHQKHPQVKSILITGHADAIAMERLKTEANTIAFFTKPWNSKELMEQVRACCLNT
ncbi:response regulator [Leptospira ognonensis]|uniref:Response regulator n=1 Tax=Leptospira ognonensis TaxID=2484945 RepID=A0A4R9K607_9LEPT|nr:response regulator [Leptospira ognonensis]TGL59727.1 response regulator [Leptospira ognonensis]